MLCYTLFNSLAISAHMAEEKSSLKEMAHIHLLADHHDEMQEQELISDHEHDSEEAHFHLSEPLQSVASAMKISSICPERIDDLGQVFISRTNSPPTPPPTC